MLHNMKLYDDSMFQNHGYAGVCNSLALSVIKRDYGRRGSVVLTMRHSSIRKSLH
jgi:hypothetical protein